MKNLSKYILYTVLFISGGSIMVLELITPRLFAPYFGTTSYIWTIVIGVVMAALSIGYFFGGRINPKKNLSKTLTYVYLLSSFYIFVINFFKDPLILSIPVTSLNPLKSAFLASLILIAPPNILLGMLTPISVNLLTKKLKYAGMSSGNVYGISTIGSIAGTFLSGFWLIPNFGIHKVLFGISLSLLLCGLATTFIYSSNKTLKIMPVAILLLYFGVYQNNDPQEIFKNFFEKRNNARLLAETNSDYQRVWVFEQYFGDSSIRILSNYQSELDVSKSFSKNFEGNFSYYEKFKNGLSAKSDDMDILMIGGGAYTFAGYVQEKYPEANIDIVEIDPKLFAISQKYFNFIPGKNINNYTTDGRIFLNLNNKKYDVIYLDAYLNGDAIPFQLVTKEADQLVSNSLKENGEFFINTISTLEGPKSILLKAQLATLQTVFENVDVFPENKNNSYIHQNIVLHTIKNTNKLEVSKKTQDNLILTDDFAPVEYLDLKRML